ncbi:hypothetical protein GLOTRDRAFT_121153 [Gloeophyllum trabeum ATCC 11539]|uniref:BTB domain-containing protein n=1 Tax=Gloeophyllum trabeum (strain ATCC 11539 / FP-39264 / Madison 617) TaxID=670483 RepID=S7Q7U6_GLOTA|nr:uncharacterized protein GLOTRDRAFT_121153 [Gloeophyllum trabeum ATCC 11539]EPQ55607.1 hypothetical protein GLOTRDRAFT_121153 [Gloeophyllum trabeum ATCC 11539]
MDFNMEPADWDYFSSIGSSCSRGADAPAFSSTPVSEAVHARSLPSVSQIPTPPPSEGSPEPSSSSQDTAQPDAVTVAVSTAFFPGSQIDPLPSDLILASSDLVFFYVHSHRLLSSSSNKFNGLLGMTDHGGGAGTHAFDNVSGIPLVSVPESSTVLNVLLHVLYHLPFSHYSPTTDTLVATISALRTYGAQAKEYVAPGTHMFQMLLLHAPLNPLEIYTLAAAHDLYELAVAASAHLLSLQPFKITDEMAERMGAVYLKRLFFLYLGRIDALKRILTAPPVAHEPTLSCNFMQQKEMVRAWALAAAYLAWDAKPDLPISTIRQTMQPLADKLACDLCRQAMLDRIKDMIIQWSAVKATI